MCLANYTGPILHEKKLALGSDPSFAERYQIYRSESEALAAQKANAIAQKANAIYGDPGIHTWSRVRNISSPSPTPVKQ